MTKFKFTCLTDDAPYEVLFGEFTKVGRGGADVGPTGTLIQAGDPAKHWQILNDVNSPGRSYICPTAAGVTSELSDGPYYIILNNGTQINITIVPGSMSENNLASVATAYAAGMPMGRHVLLRAAGVGVGLGGDYSTSADIAPTFSGNFTPPQDYWDGNVSTSWQFTLGVDLETANYTRIMPHPGDPIILCQRGFRITGPSSDGICPIRISGIYFQVYDPAQVTPPTTGMLNLRGAKYVAVDRCLFEGLDPATSAPQDRRNGVYAIPLNGHQCDNFVFQKNEVKNAYNSLNLTGSSAWNSVVDNFMHNFTNDCVKFTCGDFNRFCWNYERDVPQSYQGAHPDFFQINGAGRTVDINKNWICCNTFVRGTSIGNDGQGIYADDLGADGTSTNVWADFVRFGNRILCQYTNGMTFGGNSSRPNTVPVALRQWDRYNTVLNDPTQAQNATTINVISGTSEDSQRMYNLVSANVPAGDISVARYNDYDAFFVGGQSMFGANIGNTLAEVEANLNIIAGSAPDLTVPKTGAHQDYFDYINKVCTLPELPPYPPV